MAGVPRRARRCAVSAVLAFTLATAALAAGTPIAAAIDLFGAIRDRYDSDRALHPHLGRQIAAEEPGPAGSRQVRFERGVIQWRADRGSKAVYGAVYDKYRAFESAFGMAITDESPGGRGSRISHFDGGTIVWSPATGAHEVHGSIRDRWQALGADNGFLGLPTSDEFGGQRGSRVNRFTGGLVVWTPRTGAHEVHGAMLDEYARMRWEGGPLGAPTSDEFPLAGGWAHDFENGRLTLVPGRGYRVENFLRPSVRSASAADVRTTWRAGCPVGPDQLRVVDVNHVRYDNTIGRGQVVVHHTIVDPLLAAFRDGANGNFPIDKMVNPDAYRADDPAMMRDNNSSGFNCRSVIGNPYAVSPHTSGRAIDFNPRHNPYQDLNGRWWPENGLAWRDRTRNDPGMLHPTDPLTRSLTAHGFFWGGRWTNPDYHHFEFRGANARSAQGGAPHADALPREVLGYRATVSPPTEGEFTPNGTPFHSVAATEVAPTVLAVCASAVGGVPDAVSGVAGTYTDAGGRRGNALALRFADDRDAQRWFAAYAEQQRGCTDVPGTETRADAGPGRTRISELVAGDAQLTSRRHQRSDGSDWAELVRVRDATVVLVTLSGTHHEATTLQAAAAAL